MQEAELTRLCEPSTDKLLQLFSVHKLAQD